MKLHHVNKVTNIKQVSQHFSFPCLLRFDIFIMLFAATPRLCSLSASSDGCQLNTKILTLYLTQYLLHPCRALTALIKTCLPSCLFFPCLLTREEKAELSQSATKDTSDETSSVEMFCSPWLVFWLGPHSKNKTCCCCCRLAGFCHEIDINLL